MKITNLTQKRVSTVAAARAQKAKNSAGVSIAKNIQRQVATVADAFIRGDETTADYNKPRSGQVVLLDQPVSGFGEMSGTASFTGTKETALESPEKNLQALDARQGEEYFGFSQTMGIRVSSYSAEGNSGTQVVETDNGMLLLEFDDFKNEAFHINSDSEKGSLHQYGALKKLLWNRDAL